MERNLYDTHMHLNADQYNEDLDEVIKRSIESGVKYMNIVGFDRNSIKKAIEISKKHENIYLIVGWHPVDSIYLKDGDLEWIKEICLTNPKVVAYGEIGLDYHWDTSPKDLQQKLFRKQIRLAKELKMPIIIHSREAIEDTYEILKEEGADEIGGVIHSYSGSVEMMEKFLELNFHISLGGPVTFKNAKVPKEVAKNVPLSKLLIETDSPYLAPHPYRGKRNEPGYVGLVAEEIANLRGLTVKEIEDITTDNAKRLFFR